jgi:putative FmdB family regulatory protein
MPIYEFECPGCKKRKETYSSVKERKLTTLCINCGLIMQPVFSLFVPKIFRRQTVDVTITERSSGDERLYSVGNKQELRDVVNRYNDTEQASKTGKVAVFDQLQGREV